MTILSLDEKNTGATNMGYTPESTMWRDTNMLHLFSGSVIPKCFPFAAASCALTIILGLTTEIGGGSGDTILIFHPYVYSAYAVGVTFAVVFRAQISYARYWEAASNIQCMSSKLVDVCCQAICFDTIYPSQKMVDGFEVPSWKRSFPGQADNWAVHRFRRRIMHLLSLTHAVILHSLRLRGLAPSERKEVGGEIRGVLRKWTVKVHRDDNGLVTTFTLDDPGRHLETAAGAERQNALCFEVMGDVSEFELQALEPHAHHIRPHILLSWVIQEVTERKKQGGLAVDTPIITRLYQELSNAFLAYAEAYKVVDRPFPFPYMQVIVWLLISHSLLLPVVLTRFVQYTSVAAVLDFLVVLIFWCLEACSREIENCFGVDDNDINMHGFQHQFNLQLLTHLSDAPESLGPLKQLSRMAQEWDVKSPDIFINRKAGMNVESEWLLKLAAISQGAAPIINVAGTYDEKGETGRSLRGITIKQVGDKLTAKCYSFGPGEVHGTIYDDRTIKMDFPIWQGQGPIEVNGSVLYSDPAEIHWEGGQVWVPMLHRRHRDQRELNRVFRRTGRTSVMHTDKKASQSKRLRRPSDSADLLSQSNSEQISGTASPEKGEPIDE